MKKFIILALSLLFGISSTHPQGRERPIIVCGQVKADNGFPLRGDMIYTNDGLNPNHYFTKYILNYPGLFDWYVDSLHLNALRLPMYRWPVSYTPAPVPGYIPNKTRTAMARNDTAKGRVYSGQVIMDTVRLFAIIDTFANRTERYGMYLMIDYHPTWGLDTVDWYRFWSHIAPRYKDRKHVFYELANEPQSWPNPNGFAKGWGGHREPLIDNALVNGRFGWMKDFQKRMYNFVRARAPNTLLILASFSGAAWDSTRNKPITMTKFVQDYWMPPAYLGFDWTKTAVGWHGYMANKNVYPGARDSVIFNCAPKFSVLMTEHTLQRTASDDTKPELKALLEKHLFNTGSDHRGRGWEAGGHSWFLQTLQSHYSSGNRGVGEAKGWYAPFSLGRVLIDYNMITWPKDPKTR